MRDDTGDRWLLCDRRGCRRQAVAFGRGRRWYRRCRAHGAASGVAQSVEAEQSACLRMRAWDSVHEPEEGE